MKKIIQSIFTFSMLLFIAGCHSTVDSVENAYKSAVPDEVLRRHVETDMSQRIKVSNLIERTAPNGFKQIGVEFTNTSSSPRTVFYRCEWLDENGMSVSTSMTQWKEDRFMARDVKQVVFTAPNANAKDFKIRISERPR